MPRIDPNRLLKCLRPLLSEEKAIKSDKEVDKIYGLMSKFSKKLVSKCMYINILKETSPEILDVFMQRGGWEMVYGWTAEANATKNYALLTEIASLLLKTPASTARLKENEMPKIIKNLSRESDREETRNIARQVFYKWMTIAKNEESPSSAQNSRVLQALDSSGNSSTFEIDGVNIGSNVLDNESIVIVDSDCPQNEFDVNQYFSNADLSELEFNPELFNTMSNTMDQHLIDTHLNPVLEQAHSNIRVFPADSTSSLEDGTVQIELREDIQQNAQMLTESTGEQHGATPNTVQKPQPYALVTKNGKHYLMKIQQMQSSPQANLPKIENNFSEKDADRAMEESPRRKIKKEAVVKRPNPVVPGGKPSMKTYTLKVKTAEAKALSLATAATKNEKSGNKHASDPGKKKTSSSSKTGVAADPKKSTVKQPGKTKTSSKSAAEAAASKEADEKLRKKIAEQRKLVDLRKKEADREKLQKEKDEATLKALKLSVSSTKISKIPKKPTASFSDMIGIPGVKDDSTIERKKIKKRDSLDGSSTPHQSNSSTTPPDKVQIKSSSVTIVEEKPEVKERKHRPKVYNNNKSRSLSLLEDMELTLKEKEKPVVVPDEAKNAEADKILFDNDKMSKISKGQKRPSIDAIGKPGEIKKSKTSDEKDKRHKDKESKKKDKHENDSKSKDKEINSKKVVGIQESSLFMDAITASASTAKSMKRKRRTSSSGELPKDLDQPGKDKTSKPKLITSPTEETAVKPTFNFYRDTLGDDDNKPTISKEEDSLEEKGSEEEKDAFEPEEGEGVLKSALILHRPKFKLKKTVHWKEEENLKVFHFFDLDETERVNVARQNKNFLEMKQIERSEERKIIRRNLFGVVDIMEEKTAWKTPLPFLLDLPPVPITSKEKAIQEERERGILEVFYFAKTQVPDSADESLIVPNFDLTPPVSIPFDDDTTSEIHVQDQNQKPQVDIFLKTGNPDISLNVGMGAPGGTATFETLLENGFGFPPPAFENPAPEPFNTWNSTNNPFAMPIPMSNGPVDIWNAASEMQQGFANFQNPNLGMPPIHPTQYPINPFGFPPPFGGLGGPRLASPPVNHFANVPGLQRGNSHLRGRGFPGGRDREYNSSRDMGRDDFRRDRDRDRERDRDRRDGRDREKYDRERDRDNRDYGGRDRGGREYGDNRGRRVKRVPCRYFAMGKCKAGETCEFLHETGRGDSRNSRSKTGSPPRSSSSSVPIPNPNPDEDWDAPAEPISTTASTSTSENGASTEERRDSVEESRFTLPPSSPDCLPPGTEPPVLMIPVTAQHEDSNEVSCLS